MKGPPLTIAAAADRPDPEVLVELARQRMPFGKYKGWPLLDLPEPYLAWFARQGFPPGKLGMLLSTALEVKTNGLRELVRPLARDVSSEER